MIGLQILITFFGAVLFDWILYVQVQNITSAIRQSSTTKYKLGNPLKFLLIDLYLIPLNIIVAKKIQEINIYWYAFGIFLALYGVFAAFSAAKDSKKE